ncbi:Glucosamine-1-phosphate N-acetyltransferase., Phosphoglucomutase [Xylanimonas cellulosilytica DSM 15894]|uniref:Glucosamine-1-phosphate N-acetyltransferase., Phosphoglucomutase n=1 Tax=Xylanimonas cellulosilytica (strain DSM 15894 / JCM 12276 / CECT 5975 / KCTC 9989 / LMG 20990 / NBRC 107835 / XIL07) TaxID=446471 RepID=D1BZ10_XYLCX|nr:NTP transferase domain-containing protein [Xylanimonas cellulosilytica]ACZ30085.1 Glucosamine-1-phosphate N-acetyltransferase., Phosphoglucomutase [Xylanimonas cellulosilytica DSM 15894]
MASATPLTSAVVLAAGHDDVSRSLLTHPLGGSTVVGAAVGTVTRVVDPSRVVVVVAPGDTAVREALGDGYTYVEQAEPRGTGDAVLTARAAIEALGTDRVLVAYADTPLLRPDSLRGLLHRFTLKDADLAILTAVVDDVAQEYGEYGEVVREATPSGPAPIIAIRDQAEQHAPREGRTELNVGAYAAHPGLLFGELEAMAADDEHRLTELARRIIGRGKSIHSYQIYDTSEVRGINTPEQLAQAADIVLARLFVPVKNTDTQIVFGTGGWRALIGEGYTLANVRRLSQAIANEVTRRGLEGQGVVIGGDRRFLSRESAEAAAEVFAGNNIPVTLLRDDVPTPLVTFAAPYLQAAYGIIITSSHNPPQWNGMKVFRADGSLPLDDETNRYQDEANALSIADVVTLDLARARETGVVVDRELDEPYIDAIEEIIDVDAVRGSGLRVIVDAMYGTSQSTLGTILTDMRVRAEFIHAQHNPLFGGIAPAPDSERLHALKGLIERGGGRYSLGMATDGDSDRIGIVDEQGEYVEANDLLLLLYWYLHEVRGERGGVVRNLATTHMLDRLAAHFGEESREVKVGFKHVTAGMEEIGAVLGGESSGGLTVRGWLLGKDGIFACALVAEMLARTGKTISALRQAIWDVTGRLYMAEADVPATPEMRVEVPRRLASEPLTHVGAYPVASVSHIDGTKIVLEDGGWALLRFSGTEPLLRMVAEAATPEQARELLDWLKGFVTA